MVDEKDAPASDFAPFAVPRWIDVIELAPGQYHCAVCGALLRGEIKQSEALTADYTPMWCQTHDCANHGIRLRLPIKRTNLQVDE